MGKKNHFKKINTVIACLFLAVVATACALWFYILQESDRFIADKVIVEGPRPTEAVTIRRDARNKEYLSDVNGLTLYYYAKDTIGETKCDEACLAKWPALKISGQRVLSKDDLPGALSFIVWSDNSRQVTYKGLPLYYFMGDVEPGDMNGDKVGGVWSVVRP